MADITMCSDTDCQKRFQCYRYVADPDARQSWFVKSPRKKDACEDFWEAGSDEIKAYKKRLKNHKVKNSQSNKELEKELEEESSMARKFLLTRFNKKA